MDSKSQEEYLDMPPEDLDKKSAFAAGTAHEPEVRAKLVLGPYQLLQSIGVGGMGEVWLAEQRQPVRRRVAIKLIKTGMDTRGRLSGTRLSGTGRCEKIDF
jgi:serine/threonine protein kinase